MKLPEKLRTLSWKTYLKIALCLCAAVAIGLFAREMIWPSAYEKEIPRVEKSEDGVVVHFPKVNNLYGNRYFYHGNSFYEDVFDFRIPKELWGERIGYVGPNKTEPGITHYIGNQLDAVYYLEGDIYTVKGYDPTFLLCHGGHPFVRTGGFVMKYGYELYRDELHLSEDGTKILLPQKTKNGTVWNEIDHSAESRQAVEQFLEEIYNGEFIPDQSNLRESHLGSVRFQKADGITVDLIIYEGGYVYCWWMNMLCLKVPDNEFATCLAALQE